MKKLSLAILAVITIISCSKEHPKDYLTFSGKLENNKDTILSIKEKKGVIKEIKINKDGTFKDTLFVPSNGNFIVETNSGKKFPIHLSNGNDLKLAGDTNDFINTFSYSGTGSNNNNFIISQFQFNKKALGDRPRSVFMLDKDKFDKKVKQIESGIDSVTNLYKDLDSTLLANSRNQKERTINFFKNNYDKIHKLLLKEAEENRKINKGMVSPKFVNYQNFKGGKTSLDDLKGKYVYIDMWATWCGPCIKEIPSLQKLEKDYHGKNIQFVSISIDNERTAGTWEKAEEKWKKMVADKNLSGIQLYASKDIEFVKGYKVTTIPRFILIDPKGNIVDSNAPRPSSQQIRDLFSELGI